MHPSAWLACQLLFSTLHKIDYFADHQALNVLEIGSKDTNGTMRNCFTSSPLGNINDEYTGIPFPFYSLYMTSYFLLFIYLHVRFRS